MHRLRTLALVFVCLASSCLQAQQTPKDFINEFFQRHNLSTNSVNSLSCQSEINSFGIYKTDSAFAIVQQTGDGYTLVGYSLDKPIAHEVDSLPPQLCFLLSNAHQNLNLIERSVESVPPLCSAEWSQGWPYNTMCPEFGRGRALVGCVATAMSQAMYVHKHPLQGEGSISYVLPNELKRVTYDFSESTYDWDSMLDTYTIRDSEKKRNAVALLCSDAGKAVRMSYGVDASGAYTEDAFEALRSYFGYSCSELDIWERYEYGSQEQWNNRIYEELDAGRPVIYSATSREDSGMDSNHCFLLDGYDENGFVHVNWGWGGSGNGYYNIELLDVPPYEYSLNHTMIVGMQPRINEGDTIKRQYRPTLWEEPLPVALSDVKKIKRHDNIVLSDILLRNNNIKRLTWECCVALFDGKWNFIETLSPYQNISINAYKNSETPYLFVLNIPSHIPNGIYNIALASREQGREEWCRIKAKDGIENNCIPITITKDWVKLNVHDYTGINTITKDENTNYTTYYTLNGMKIKGKPERGFFLKKRRDSSSYEKYFIK